MARADVAAVQDVLDREVDVDCVAACRAAPSNLDSVRERAGSTVGPALHGEERVRRSVQAGGGGCGGACRQERVGAGCARVKQDREGKEACKRIR